MATPTWTDVPDTNLEPGDPIRSIDIIAINNHAAAMAGGQSNAPKITLMAIETLSSGTTIRSRNDAEVASATTDIIHQFEFCQIGTINFYVEHKCTASSFPSIVEVKRLRNGTESTLISWSTTSTSYVARNIDISVLPGDLVTIYKSGGSFVSTTSTRYARFRTGGENLWPGNSARLENNYTVV